MSVGDRENILKDFYALGSDDAQNKYLYGLIRRETIKYRTRGAQKPQSHAFTCHIRLNDGSDIQVCKKTFCDLYAVGKRRVEKLADQLSTGVQIASDKRGKHKSRPHAIPEELKKQVREHIEPFPRRKTIPAQITRKDSTWMKGLAYLACTTRTGKNMGKGLKSGYIDKYSSKSTT